MIRKICLFNSLMIVLFLAATCAWADEFFIARPAAPTIIVQLPENPTTGYQWVLIRYDRSLLEAPSSHYVSSASQLPGAPGYVIWEFRVRPAAFKDPQETLVILEYKRLWEKSAVQKKMVRIKIQMR